MVQRMTVGASTFARNFGKYQDAAIQSGVIVVTSHERVVGGYLSAHELEHYERLKMREYEVLKVGSLPDDVVDQIAAAEYGVEAG